MATIHLTIKDELHEVLRRAAFQRRLSITKVAVNILENGLTDVKSYQDNLDDEVKKILG